MNPSLIQTIVVYALPVIFAITLHEAAHGYVARLLGDNTAYMMGRVSFNPMRHIDPIGTIAIPLVLYLVTSGAFMFGYAKPVPVTFGNLRNPRWGTFWVARWRARCATSCRHCCGASWRGCCPRLGVDEPFFTRMAAAGVVRQSRAVRAQSFSAAAARRRARADGAVAGAAGDFVRRGSSRMAFSSSWRWS